MLQHIVNAVLNMASRRLSQNFQSPKIVDGKSFMFSFWSWV